MPFHKKSLILNGIPSLYKLFHMSVSLGIQPVLFSIVFCIFFIFWSLTIFIVVLDFHFLIRSYAIFCVMADSLALLYTWLCFSSFVSRFSLYSSLLFIPFSASLSAFS